MSNAHNSSQIKKHAMANSSNSRSEFMYRGGHTSLGGGPLIGNTAGTGALHMNSNMNESELEIEFGYCSEEESVF
jgi:hypothetical protein